MLNNGGMGWIALLLVLGQAQATDPAVGPAEAPKRAPITIQEVEAPLFKAVMNYTKGNQSKAAEMLGINRGTLRKKLRIYGLLG